MKNLIERICNVSYSQANIFIKQISGIVDYFASEEDKKQFVSVQGSRFQTVNEDRASYGDWQTPRRLADLVCERHISKFGQPDVVIEPTCGLGAFVFSALDKFTNLSEIYAVEINVEYVNDLKLRLLIDALSHSKTHHPDIYIYHADFFKFDFSPIAQKAKDNHWNLAVIGNPPWVTNSQQGRNMSLNVPLKQNNYGLKGIEAITGKSNFDISEYITIHLLRMMQQNKGGISFLLKNSVIRNILIKQKKSPLRIGDIEQDLIDASSEFNVSVDASCLSARFDSDSSMLCRVMDFYDNSDVREYGWVGNSFVSDISLYNRFSKFDNRSSYEWRSGIKHDCASVLELTLADDGYVNGLGELVEIEDDLIYPLLKSSDIKGYKANEFRKYLIVPQCSVGDDTSMLQYSHPHTYSYLSKHQEAFLSRKSSVYKDKDKFCIFGIGEYSFKPYKIVVSSLYKTVRFVLVSEFNGKPVMVDDTCYQLDFDNEDEAKCIYDAIQSDEIQSLLSALSFNDAKRVVTKSLLMRLDLGSYCKERGWILDTQRFKNGSCRQLSLFD